MKTGNKSSYTQMEQTKVYLIHKTERLSEVKEIRSLTFGRGVKGRGSYVEGRGHLVEGRLFRVKSPFFQDIFIFHTD